MNRNQKAFELWQKGQHSQAIKQLFEEIDQRPENIDSYYNLANMLLIARKEADAKAVLDLADEKNPNHPEISYAYGIYYYQLQDYPQAIHAFLKVLSQGTAEAEPVGSQATEQAITPAAELRKDSIMMLAQAYLALENPRKALAFLVTAEKENPADSELLLLMGNTFMQVEAFKEAQNYFDKVIELAPEKPEAWFKRGLSGMTLEEEPTKFNRYFEKAKEIDEVYYQKQMQQLAEIQAFIKKNQVN